MDSYIAYDKTLPIDMNGSNNPNLLTEVTYGQIGASPMMEKSGTGRMSPVRGRTMKEYDLQISELKKENFNLKLRIFFLEERLNTKYSGEDTIKTNIELKVEVESYKKDLQEKQQMLEKASETIDSMTAKYSEELEKEVMKINRDFEEKQEDTNRKVEELHDCLKELEDQLRDKDEELAGSEDRLTEHKDTIEVLKRDKDERDGEIADLNGQLKACRRELETVRGDAESQKQLYEAEIELLTTSKTRKDRDIQRLSVIVKDRTTIEGITALERSHLQDAAEDANRQVEKLKKMLANQERESGRRADMMGKMEDLLREKEHEKDALSKALDDKTDMYQRCKENLAAFIKALHDKKLEYEQLEGKNSSLLEKIRRLEDKIGSLEDELEQLRQQAHAARIRETEKVGHMETELEGLARSLGKKEGELEQFKDLLETAERSLCDSEEVVKSLERELAKVRRRSNISASDDEVAQLHQELDASRAQLEDKDRLYRAKCAEMDTIARSLNINVSQSTPSSSETDLGKSEMLQKIVDELKTMKEAFQSDRHLHISISSAFQAQDGGVAKHEGNGITSPAHPGQQNSQHHQQQHASRIPVRTASSSSVTGQDDTDALRYKTDSPNSHDGADALHYKPGSPNSLDGADAPGYKRGSSNSHDKTDALRYKPCSPNGHDGFGHLPNNSGSSISNDESGALRCKLMELQARNQDLERTLRATEETVHCQTQKMKFYRGMLADHDLLPPSLARSSSLSNIDRLTHSPRRSPSPGSQPRQRTGSLDNQSRASRSMDSMLPADRKRDQTERLTLGNGFEDSDRVRAERLARENGLADSERDQAERITLGNGFGDSERVRAERLARENGLANSERNRAERLARENGQLKQQVDGYKKVLKAFQDRSPSPPGVTGDKQPVSSESACRQLEGWLDMLDRFLLEVSQSDQCGASPTVSSTTDLTTLRRGLIHARGAIHTLSETSLVESGSRDDKSSCEGRLSPDSGCSDYNTASAPHTLRSPLVSPARSQSSSESAQDNTATSPRQHKTSPRNVSGTQLNSPPNQCFPSDTQPGSPPYMRHDKGFPSDTKPGSSPYMNQENGFPGDTQPGSNPYMKHDKGFPSDTQLSSPSVMRHEKTYLTDTRLGSSPYLRHDKGLDIRSLYRQTLTKTMLGNLHDDTMADKTMGDQFSYIDFGDNSLFDITMAANADKAELQEKIGSLEEMIRSLQDQISEQSGPDMDSLQQQLAELKKLRLQLEKSLKQNENLQQQLLDHAMTSESTIQGLKKEIDDLHNQLAKCQDTVIEKVHIIHEKERIITEINTTLTKLRDNSASDVEVHKEKVKCLELELNEKSSKCTQMANMCKPLKNAVEQFKKRCEQLEGDNKKHLEALNKHQHRVKDLENEMKVKCQNAERLEAEVDQHKNRIAELESDSEQYKENEAKYKTVLAQNRSQLAKLVDELEQVREEYKQLQVLKEELESARDTIEEQDRQLIEKSLRIEQLTKEWNDKQEMIQKHDEERQNMRISLESANEMNSKLSTQLEQQRMNCASYKRQVDRNNHAQKELKDKIDALTEEMAQHQNNKESIEKELKDTTYTRDKYLFNLKFMHKEFRKCKKELEDSQQKYKDSNNLNNSLKVELHIRETLSEQRGDMLTDDAKQNMIAELLNELKCARVQMTTILEQNDKIKQQMMQILKDYEAAKKSGGSTSNEPRSKEEFRESSSSFAANTSSTSMSEELMHSARGSNSTRHSLPAEFCESPVSFGGNTSSSLSEESMQSIRGSISSRHSLPTREGTLEGSAGSNDSLSKSREFGDPFSSRSGSDVGSGNYFSVPGPIYKQGMSDHCLLYNVNDSPKHVAGLTQYRIDSDIRSLFAIGMIDHFEKLRKETNECNILLKGLSTRINERLKIFTTMPASESLEYSTLKELSYSAEHLRICVDGQRALIGCFWTSELPAPNDRGEFVNTKMLNENCELREHLTNVLAENDILVKSCAGLDRVKREKTLEEEHVCRSLVSTLDLVSRAKSNLQEKNPISPRRPNSPHTPRSPHRPHTPRSPHSPYSPHSLRK